MHAFASPRFRTKDKTCIYTSSAVAAAGLDAGGEPERMGLGIAPTGSSLPASASALLPPLPPEPEVEEGLQLLAAGSRGGDKLAADDDKLLELETREILLTRAISETLRDSWSMSAASSMARGGVGT